MVAVMGLMPFVLRFTAPVPELPVVVAALLVSVLGYTPAVSGSIVVVLA